MRITQFRNKLQYPAQIECHRLLVLHEQAYNNLQKTVFQLDLKHKRKHKGIAYAFGNFPKS